MTLFVFRQTLRGDEAFPTLLTFIGLVMVYLLMILEVPYPREARATVATLEKPALDVSEEVVLQTAGLLKTLPTLSTVMASTSFGTTMSELFQ